jgi:hypothetical protein
MKMMKQTEKTTNELFSALENPDNKEKVLEAKLDNPVEEMGKDLMSFFKGRLELVNNLEEFKQAIQTELLKRIQEDKNVTFSQLSNLFISIFEQGSVASEGIISLLRPSTAPGISNPILASMTKKDNKLEENNLNIPPEDLPKLDALFRLLQKMEEQEKIKK